MTGERRTLRVLTLVLVGVALALLASLPVITLINPAPRALLQGVLAAVGIAGLLVAIVRPRHAWYHLAAGALLTATGVAAVVSTIPSAAGPAVLMSASLAGIGVLALEWTSTPQGRRDASVVVGVGLSAMIGGTFLIACTAVWLEWASLGLPLRDLPLRPGAVGGLVPGFLWTTDYLILTAPIGVVLLWTQGRWGRVGAVALSAIAVASVIVGATRAVWAVEAVILIFVALLWLRRQPLSPRRLSFVTSFVVLGIVGAATLFAGRLEGLLRSVDEGRTTAITAAVAIASRHPLLGAGPGTYGSLKMAEPADVLSQVALPDPHNLLALVAAELGVTGLVALGIAALAVLWAARRAAPARDVLSTAGIVGLAALLAHRMADMVLIVPGIAVMALIVGAITLPDARDEPKRARIFVRVVAASILVTLCVAIPATLTRANADAAYRQAVGELDAGEPQWAITAATTAVTLAPDHVPAYTVRSIARAAAGDLEGALSDARRAVELESSTQAWLRTAVLLDAMDRPNEAADLYRAIAVARPPDPAALLTAAVALSEQGDAAGAGDAMDRLIRADPRIARVVGQLPAPLAAIGRERARVVAAESLAAGDLLTAIQIVTWLDGRDAAVTILASSLPDARSGWVEVAAALGGSDDAWAALDTSARDHPTRSALSAWWVAGEICRIADRDRWSRVMQIQWGGAPKLPVSAGMAPESHGDVQPPRYPTWIWGVPSPRTPYTDGTWLVQYGQPNGCGGG